MSINGVVRENFLCLFVFQDSSVLLCYLKIFDVSLDVPFCSNFGYSLEDGFGVAFNSDPI